MMHQIRIVNVKKVFFNFNILQFLNSITMKQTRTPWTNDEDKILKQLVKKYGVKKWDQVSEQFNQKCDGNERLPQQCKERWSKMLNPKINKEQWRDQEIKQIFELHKKFGNKWKQIAKKLNKRIDNDVKNQFLNAIRKGIRRICKEVSIGNSTEKVKNLKPKVISNIMCELSQRETTNGDSQLGVYQIVFELSRQNISNHIKKQLERKQFLQILKSQINKIFTYAFLQLLNRRALIHESKGSESSIQFESSQNTEKQQEFRIHSNKSQLSNQIRMINEGENIEGLSNLSHFGFDFNFFQSQINQRISSNDSNLSLRNYMLSESPQSNQKSYLNQMLEDYLNENQGIQSEQEIMKKLKYE